MYNRMCKSIKYMYWVKKRLVWACLGLFERCDSIEDIKRVIKS